MKEMNIKTISTNEWNELKSLVLDIKEKVTKIADEAGKELLTPPEVCILLKISRSTYQRYINKKVLEQTMVGGKAYVSRSGIEKLMNEGKI